MREFGIEQYEADQCDMRPLDVRAVSIVVVHVDDIFSMGLERMGATRFVRT